MSLPSPEAFFEPPDYPGVFDAQKNAIAANRYGVKNIGSFSLQPFAGDSAEVGIGDPPGESGGCAVAVQAE